MSAKHSPLPYGDGEACLMEGKIGMAAQTRTDESFQGRIQQGHEEGEEADSGPSGSDRHGPLRGSCLLRELRSRWARVDRNASASCGRDKSKYS